jgi:hypothetical protein
MIRFEIMENPPHIIHGEEQDVQETAHFHQDRILPKQALILNPL